MVNGVITDGAQLAIGTPFSKKISTFGDFANVRVMAKVRVPEVDQLGKVFIGISDSADTPHLSSSIDQLPSMVDETWKVIEHSKSGGWDDPEWDTENLRVVLTFVGLASHFSTVSIANEADVEWIAIYLTGDPVTP